MKTFISIKTLHIAVALINLGLLALIGFCIYLTKNPWCLLGLFFLVGTKAKSGICPKCKEYVIFEDEEFE